MTIIQKNPNHGGAYPSPNSWSKETPPNGYAVMADTVDMTDFYAHNGFVTLTIEAIEHTRQTEDDNEVYTVDTVTAYAPNIEAWEAWRASLPEPQEPEPTAEEDTAAMLVDHEFRLTMLELGLSE